MAAAVEAKSKLLTTKIIRNPPIPSIFHSDFDNFDQKLNELTGNNAPYSYCINYKIWEMTCTL